MRIRIVESADERKDLYLGPVARFPGEGKEIDAMGETFATEREAVDAIMSSTAYKLYQEISKKLSAKGWKLKKNPYNCDTLEKGDVVMTMLATTPDELDVEALEGDGVSVRGCTGTITSSRGVERLVSRLSKI